MITDLPSSPNQSISFQPASATAMGALTRREWGLAALAALAALLLSVALAGHRGFWLDEYYTLRAARMSLAEMAQDRLGAGHSPLYFIYARLGLALGGGERALRFSSALALGAAVLLLTGLAGTLRLRHCLPALWALCLVQPYWISTGTEYRYMMPVIALAAAVAWATAGYARAWDWRAGAAAAALLTLLLWIHSSAQFTAAGLLVFLLWEGRRCAGRWSAAAVARAWPVLAGLAASAPLLALLRGAKLAQRAPKLTHLDSVLKDLVAMVFNVHTLWPGIMETHKFADALVLLPTTGLLGVAIWLARRELRSRGCDAAWRLLLALMAGIPAAQSIITTFIHRVEGPARYLAAFSIPATLCLALAWHAPLAPWKGRLFRGALVFFLGFQALGAALNLGDLHREAIRWVLANHHDEVILVSSKQMNEFAFRYLGGAQIPGLRGLTEPGTPGKPPAREELKTLIGQARRGFIFLYHDDDKVARHIAELQAEGFFTDARLIPVSGDVRLYAFIRAEAERGWLAGLPAFQRPWGPAEGDATPYPNE